jgi:hypothetical protein
MHETSAKFSLGQFTATPGALAAMRLNGDQPASLLARHQRGDFGELDPQDVREQNLALAQEHDAGERQRMMSVYRLSEIATVWIITEADRSSTCILLPDEY